MIYEIEVLYSLTMTLICSFLFISINFYSMYVDAMMLVHLNSQLLYLLGKLDVIERRKYICPS